MCTLIKENAVLTEEQTKFNGEQCRLRQSEINRW